MTKQNRHECHAARCRIAVPPRMLMCLRHWRMVPRDLQRRVWATYVPGQEVRKNPTSAYMEAHHAAIAAVARSEGLVVEADAHEALSRSWGEQSRTGKSVG